MMHNVLTEKENSVDVYSTAVCCSKFRFFVRKKKIKNMWTKRNSTYISIDTYVCTQ